MTSPRRRARAATWAPAPSGVPPVLLDPHGAFWWDSGAVADEAARWGLDYVPPPPCRIRGMEWRDPLQRFRAFRRAYAKQQGLMSTRWPKSEDWRKYQELGIHREPRRRPIVPQD